MATLVIKSGNEEGREIRLRLGVNRLGRDSSNNIQIENPSISSSHCELEILGNSIAVRDCGSTNGTFIDGIQVESGEIHAGHVLRVGTLELSVQSTEVAVAIPRVDVAPAAAPPVVLANGTLICPRHFGIASTHRCTHCREVMCERCLKRIRRRGGKTLELCVKCSHRCHRLRPKTRKKGILGFLNDTIKLPWVGRKKALTLEA